MKRLSSVVVALAVALSLAGTAAIGQTPAAAPAAPNAATPPSPPPSAPTEAAPQGAPSAAAPPTAAAPGATPAAPAAAPQAAPPPAPAPATEMVENPYGLSALWNAGDIIARGTLVLLLIMSMGSWYVIITKFIEQVALAAQARQAERNFWRATGIREGAEQLKRRSAFRLMIEDGLTAAERRDGTLTDEIEPQAWITLTVQHSSDAITARMQRGLAFLATVGSTAPFVGLFGTVWGIYHALTAIGIAGQASIDKVAGPVGEALIMTAMGLAVAVPAVLGYNWLVRRNKAILDRVRNFAGDLVALLTNRRVPAERTVERV
ncbi:MAG TPA: MotA/TolQ/ExbB proton channel family protein [Stellaceae bacterium]|nr:MotA/TolQ/ExbB proton channel family protein [Stellaceae bacterium]